MAKTHRFVVSTENVNCYGSRVLTDGIDTTQYEKNPVVLFMHQRNTFQAKGNEVIGRCVSLKKEAGQLIAEIEFDENEPFAKSIADKVERGFIRMASPYLDIMETTSDPALILTGQSRETISKSRLGEISIVDIGGNDDALKLFNDAGEPAQIKLLNQKSENKMSELKTIALALGKPADASESDLLNTVTELKLAKTTAETKTQEWEGKYLALQKTEAEKLVNKAVSLGLIPEDLKDVQVKAFETDFDGQSVKLAKLIDAKETENETNGVQTAIGAVVTLSKGGKQTLGEGQDSFDYLQKHNAVELSRIRNEEPQKYVQLVKGYSEGVRYTVAK